jgi:hypothetical protein
MYVILDSRISTLWLTLNFLRSIDLRHVHERIGRRRFCGSRRPPLMDSRTPENGGLNDSRPASMDFH